MVHQNHTPKYKFISFERQIALQVKWNYNFEWPSSTRREIFRNFARKKETHYAILYFSVQHKQFQQG